MPGDDIGLAYIGLEVIVLHPTPILLVELLVVLEIEELLGIATGMEGYPGSGGCG
jgi:hypothetical protein